jgi:peptidoglycan/LPS O-acetylase OafA/YrhL
VTGGRPRLAGLDVARALAILLVMVSHYANNLFVWMGIPLVHHLFFLGDVGVELFFVLSGFLIGRILRDLVTEDPGWRGLGVFLLRRWLRTLPLYWLVLLALWVAVPPAAPLGATLPRFASLTQNLTRPMPHDDWFAVSWSLTVEEWFYLAFAVAAVAVARLSGRRWAIIVPLLALLACPLAARLATPAFADARLGLTKVAVFRMDEIGYGVALAWLHARDSRLLRWPLLLLAGGVALVAATWFKLLPIPDQLYEALRYSATALGCALCLPAALRLTHPPRWLDATARTVSRQAYALYLTHLTILVDVVQPLWWDHRLSTPLAVAAALVLPFVVAEALSRGVELPVMRVRPSRRVHAATPVSAAWAEGVARPPRRG